MAKDDTKTQLPSGLEIRALTSDDLDAMSALHTEIFGPGRFTRSAYRAREGGFGVSAHSRGAFRDDALVGSVSLTAIAIGNGSADGRGDWLLGPVAVRSTDAGQKIGQQLIASALKSVTDSEGASATVILVGDYEYYGRFGFGPVPRGQIRLPGPVDPARLLVWRGPDGARDIPSGLVKAA